MFEIVKATELPFDPRQQMGRIFADGFYQWLKYFAKDKERLGRAMAHIFKLTDFYVATQGGKIAAITSCTDGNTPPIALDAKTLRSELGPLRGRIAYSMLTKHLVNYEYPFELSKDTGSIEFVATASEFRWQGAASELVQRIVDDTPYSEYVLEVADNNTAAVRLYQKLGFTEFKRVPAPKNSGFDNYAYMRLVPAGKAD